MPSISQEEIAKYWEIFQAHNPQNGALNEQQVVALLRNSQLPDELLNQVWNLSDIDGDRKMDFEEFCVAMRLVFDHIQSPNVPIPQQLPQWLVPASKQHLLDAKLALSGNAPIIPSTASLNNEDEELNLRADFNWYIAPSERHEYEQIYAANCDSRGGISFDDLTELYKMLTEVPATDVSSAWNLVNPKSEAKIDKEQTIVFLHILNQRHRGVRIPRSVPASLRATFGREKINYDVSGPQAEIKKPLVPEKTQSATASYLSKLGLGASTSSNTNSNSNSNTNTGVDLLTGGDDDWEEVRLKRELNDLNTKLARIEESKKQKKQMGSSNSSLIRRELEAMLEYKQNQLAKPVSSGSKDLSSTKEEVDLIAEQLDALRDHLRNRQAELQTLLG